VNISALFDLEESPDLAEARDWSRSFGDSVDEWWRQCPHGDAMLHAMATLSVDFAFLFAASHNCAQLVSELLPAHARPQAIRVLEASAQFINGKLKGEALLETQRALLASTREQRMSEPEACAVSAVAMLIERPTSVPALVADAYAIAAFPKHNTGIYDEAGYKRAYDDANERCAHAIREMLPADLIKLYFDLAAEADAISDQTA
jgi:hypothetical protein